MKQGASCTGDLLIVLMCICYRTQASDDDLSCLKLAEEERKRENIVLSVRI